VSAKYKGAEKEYDFHFKSLWDWACDILLDADLVSHFQWDAQRLYKYHGAQFKRFYDEPWTGQRFWEIQVSNCYCFRWPVGPKVNHKDKLPEDGKPFCIILYADKAQLSSFGTEKGYPVIARCANLPIDIRHGKGLGGGRVVGWLPIVCYHVLHFVIMTKSTYRFKILKQRRRNLPMSTSRE
jgi:hypothetical protein